MNESRKHQLYHPAALSSSRERYLTSTKQTTTFQSLKAQASERTQKSGDIKNGSIEREKNPRHKKSVWMLLKEDLRGDQFIVYIFCFFKKKDENSFTRKSRCTTKKLKQSSLFSILNLLPFRELGEFSTRKTKYFRVQLRTKTSFALKRIHVWG